MTKVAHLEQFSIIPDVTLPSCPHPAAQFVWADNLHRTQILLFRREFVLAEPPAESFPFYLFVDSRYRLFVNGIFLGSGPARFVTQFPEFDRLDLQEHLQAGPNAIVVEAYFFGCSSYQTMPDGRGGMIAWGGGGGMDLGTPGEWRMRSAEAWDRETALLSFAQNACEICDTRKLDPAWYGADPCAGEGWVPPIEVAGAERPWGELRPRSIPPQRLVKHRPNRILVRGGLADGEEIVGFRFPARSMGSPQTLPRGLKQVFQTWLRSPRDQVIDLALFWGDYWLNGQALQPEFRGARSKRCQVAVQLKEGWNCLCGTVEFLTQSEFYDGIFGLPRSAEIVLASAPDTEASGRFRLSPLVPLSGVEEWLRDGRPVERDGWMLCPGNPDRLTPGRVMAWRRVAEPAVRDEDYPGKFNGTVLPQGQVWSLAFPEEFVGHVTLDIEGPAGTVVDLAYDEWLREDGLVDLYRTNPFVNTAERFILRGGRQTVRTLNVRGGRFLQVVVSPAAGAATIPSEALLHEVWVADVRSLERGEAHFRCGDAELETIWKACVQTVVASTEDGYSDSPWRERGTYIGDFCVNQAIHHLFCADFSIPRRGLRVFAQAQLPDGQMPAVAPAHHRRPHEDFSLIWILALYDHWALTGNLSLADELWTPVERIWSSPAWIEETEGLWSTNQHNVFIDWGVNIAERTGFANGVINAFRVAALDRSADLAELTGRTGRAEEFRAEAARVRAAFSRVLWLEEEGRFAACMDEQGQLAESSATHANLLAWAFAIGTEEQRERVRTYLFTRLEQNFDLGVAQGQFGGQIELYFWSYLLPALAERGFPKEAVRWIRQHWGYVTDDGFGTLPECFCRKNIGVGSKCHSWSGYPAVFLNRFVLGLRQAYPGNTLEWVLDPLTVSGIDRAEGCQPHADGMIRVAWERRPDGRLNACVEAPESVTVRVPQGA